MNRKMITLIYLGLALATSNLACVSTTPTDRKETAPIVVGEILDAAVPASLDYSLADWRPLHYKIYATKGEAMSGDEMRKTIEQLRAIYEQQLGTEMADKTMAARLDKLKRIADSSDVGRASDATCQEQMIELNSLIDYNRPFQVNVVPFIRQNRRRLFGLCGDVFYQRAEEAIRRLDEHGDEAQIGKDFLDIMITRPKFEELADENKLAERVNELLELRKHISQDTAAKRVGDKTYGTYFDQLVSSSCGVFETKLRELVVDEYQLLACGLDLFEPHRQLSKWLRYSQVCMSLKENKKAIERQARLTFQGKNLPHELIRGRRRRR